MISHFDLFQIFLQGAKKIDTLAFLMVLRIE